MCPNHPEHGEHCHEEEKLVKIDLSSLANKKKAEEKKFAVPLVDTIIEVVENEREVRRLKRILATIPGKTESLNKLWGDLFKFDFTNYKNSKSKIDVHCNKHNTNSPCRYEKLLIGRNPCKECQKERRKEIVESTRHTTESFIDAANIVHNFLYTYLKTVYGKNNMGEVIITCPIHGDFKQCPAHHLAGRGCKTCGVKHRVEKRKYDTKIFIEKANIIHKFFYTYVKTIYTLSYEEVIITCPIHGDFKKVAAAHLQGEGCRNCYEIKNTARLLNVVKENTTTYEKWIEKAKIFHNDFYSYHKINKHNFTSNGEAIITCPIHGEYTCKRAYEHMTGAYCKDCTKIKAIELYSYTTEEIIAKFKETHGDMYIYSLVNYTGYQNDVVIICKVHGPFDQTPDNHIHGKGCRKCTRLISKPESKWLNIMNIPNDKEHRQVKIQLGKKRVFADGYCADTKTVYEMLGDYWHGNPKMFDPSDVNKLTKKTYGELYRKTIEKLDFLKNNGYTVIYIWENDFTNGKNYQYW
jgi:hypothetical protein